MFVNPVNGLIFYKAIKKSLLGYSTIPVSTAYFLNIGIQLHLVVARSDLPRALHIVCTEDSKEQIYDVQLALPGESQVTRIRKKKVFYISTLTWLLPIVYMFFFFHPKFGHGGSFWVDEYLCFHRFPANLTHIFSARHVLETSIFWLFSLFSLSGCSRK